MSKSFADKDGKIWVGVGGRNPPPEAPHLVVTTPEIVSSSQVTDEESAATVIGVHHLDKHKF